jgi:ribonuclease P protein component
MLPKKNRFSFKNDLPKNVFHSQSFTIRYDHGRDSLKVAVVVSKKVDKRATVRNKIKRGLIDIVQKTLAKNETLNLIFYVKKGALTSSDLNQEVTEALKKIT